MLSEQETAELFATSFYLKILIIFRLISSGIAIVSMTLFEINRKFEVCCASIFANIDELPRFLDPNYFRNPLKLLVSTNECLLRIIPTWAGSLSSLLVMSAERFEASRKLSTYESSTHRSGITLVFIHIVIILIVIFSNGYVYEFPSRIAHCPTVSVIMKPVHSAVVACAFFAELFTIFSYTKLLRRNKAIQASNKSMTMLLSERYQLFENIRVLRLLLPIVLFACLLHHVSHTSITIFGAAAYFYFELGGFQPETYPIFEADTINLIYLQGIIMPLIYYCRHSHKRSMETRIFATNTSTGEVLVRIHDGEITKGW
ncbi:hypothetical protein PRIPAC_75901 [Pristionchus pacificus]|uniref:G protein-coupled receptor n=1 Tax=Pristionchus pacificus TaxID=54126 RepID=A0A2A6C0G6_PRIPA|nr:hypothetical protein PRIPAC_75901 [Pristionchus pacificus]|eukprot:PDM71503.1 G protein-coupled receptor [Pristionchus pacificus]